jgi:hypothetical protein
MDADFLLSRGWFDFPEDVYDLFRELTDEEFWTLYAKRANYNHIVSMAFANCVTFPPPAFKIKLNIIEDKTVEVVPQFDKEAWTKHLSEIEFEAPEFEKDELILELDSEIKSIQNILDNYRQNKSRHDKQIINEYISSLKDLKIQKTKLESEKKAQYDRWVEKEYQRFKTNFYQFN